LPRWTAPMHRRDSPRSHGASQSATRKTRPSDCASAHYERTQPGSRQRGARATRGLAQPRHRAQLRVARDMIAGGEHAIQQIAEGSASAVPRSTVISPRRSDLPRPLLEGGSPPLSTHVVDVRHARQRRSTTHEGRPCRTAARARAGRRGAGPLPVMCARTGLTSSQTVGVGMPRSTSEARREASRAK
jgi:hypothetical protein